MNTRRIQASRLIEASLLRDARTAQALLEQGADPNAIENEHRITALMYAARAADSVLVTLLLNAGADLEARDDQGRTAIFYAPVESSVFDLLCESGADLEARASDGTGIVLANVARSVSVAAVEKLLALGVDPAVGNVDGETPESVAETLGLTRIQDRLRQGVIDRRP